MNIKEPPIKNPKIIPELLFVPCLAFDKYGFRLDMEEDIMIELLNI